MSLLLIYFLKVSFCLAIVYLFYQLLLRKLTFYNSNRWYLAGYTFLSFLIPLINITPVLEKNSFSANKIVQFIPTMDESGFGMSAKTSAPLISSFDTWGSGEWLLVALLLGATIFLIRFILGYISFYRMRRDAHLVFNTGMKLYQVNDNIMPFSFGNSVFINSALHSEDELREIIRHEYVHVKQKHTIDIIWSEWLCIVNWYNPFTWLLRSAIRQNLEFIADHKVLEKGVDRKQYQYLLLKVVGNNHFSIAQKFNFSSLKKRIAMMNTLRSTKLNLTRFLFILPLLAVVLIAFRQKQKDPQKTETVSYTIPDVSDTIPDITQTNDKGYIIELIGENDTTTVLIRDKNGKEVDRLPLSKWEENESYYKKKYGKIPPPPPPVPAIPPGPPAPPSAPIPGTIPDNVKSFEYKYDQVDVLLKDGKKESYNLKVPAERDAYERKYGVIVLPPEPAIAPAAPIAPKLPDNVSSIHVKNNRAEVWLKDGNEEVYDLKVPAQKETFEKKYGNIIVAPEPANPPGVPAKVVSVMNSTLTGMTAPVAIAGNPEGLTVVPALGTPEMAAAVVAVGDGYTIGEEEVLVTISKKTTPLQLEDFKNKMKEKGIELKYDHTDFKEGILVNISGTIKMKDNTARFSATDFSKLILSSVKNGERVFFKVTVADKHKVI